MNKMTLLIGHLPPYWKIVVNESKDTGDSKRPPPPCKSEQGGARYARVTPLFLYCSNDTYIKRGKVGSKVRVRMALPSDSETKCGGAGRAKDWLILAE
jgi:hypothetical protein